MGGEKPARRGGWVALLVAVVVEVAVLGAVGIYASVSGGPTFQSRAFLHSALTPSPSSPPSSPPSSTPSAPATQPANTEPVELEPCELLSNRDINLSPGQRFLVSRDSAGPAANRGMWSGEQGWWAACFYESISEGADGMELTVFIGPGLGVYQPEDGDRDIPDLGDEAWLIVEPSDPSMTLAVRTAKAFLTLAYIGTTGKETEQRLTTFARRVIDNLPARPEITPKRLGETCEAIPLKGAEAFLGVDLVGGRESTTPQGSTACSFAGDYGAELWLTVLPTFAVDDQRAFYREEGRRVPGIGDEAYVYADGESEPVYFVRKGDLALEVSSYAAIDEEITAKTRPTADEVTMLRSLLPEGDTITG